MATTVLTCGFDIVVRQEERAEKVEDGDDEKQPEEEGARAEGQEAVPTPEDQGGDFLGVRNGFGEDPDPRIHTTLLRILSTELRY
jgi:hypothetical protein